MQNSLNEPFYLYEFLREYSWRAWKYGRQAGEIYAITDARYCFTFDEQTFRESLEDTELSDDE